MALNKLKIGTALSTQIAEQNDNIEQIDNFMSGGGIESLVLAENIETTSSGTAQVKTFNGFATIKGVIVNRSSDMESGTLLGNLPTSARPSNNLIVSGISNTGSIQIRLMTTGEILLYSYISVNQWVSLTGITYIL